MSRKEDYEKKSEALVMPIVEANQFELVDVEFVKEAGNWYLRIYIDKDGGITVDDCEIVSRAFGEILDQKDYIDENYILEVSSPGLGRPLKKEKDFIRNMEQEVEVKLFRAVEHQKEFVGLLKGYSEQTVSIELEDGTVLVLERKNIALIRQAIIF